ncbi:hypothetical protein [Streptomyces sp. VRA16 Mangrove soil]|uniref:hypothetical protein n=1 Tax=Streptomyces sp. VRA16 Mangrove soil TaxID=2817434 RepID=UPI001A9EDC35|nr:hypothetical protein [Streptomyces sp. VRA16 Mangrove soil]MBO1334100.1 hypothetical protein [Streptomyces sp. VRA16 Mangrove soil]
MNPNSAQPATLSHIPADMASGAQLVIENLDVPADQDGVLFTVTYALAVPALVDSVA